MSGFRPNLRKYLQSPEGQLRQQRSIFIEEVEKERMAALPSLLKAINMLPCCFLLLPCCFLAASLLLPCCFLAAFFVLRLVSALMRQYAECRSLPWFILLWGRPHNPARKLIHTAPLHPFRKMITFGEPGVSEIDATAKITSRKVYQRPKSS